MSSQIGGYFFAMAWTQSFVVVLDDSTDEVAAAELQSTMRTLQNLLSVLLSEVKYSHTELFGRRPTLVLDSDGTGQGLSDLDAISDPPTSSIPNDKAKTRVWLLAGSQQILTSYFQFS